MSYQPDPKLTVKQNYHAYLTTPQWATIRAAVLQRDKYRCKCCTSRQNLQVHHSTYANLYNEGEHMDEVITLCRTCHRRVHAIDGPPEPVVVTVIKQAEGERVIKAKPRRPTGPEAYAEKNIRRHGHDTGCMVWVRSDNYQRIGNHYGPREWCRSQGVNPDVAGWRRLMIGKRIPEGYLDPAPLRINGYKPWSCLGSSRRAIF